MSKLFSKKDQEYMNLALDLAAQGEGMVSPNPLVGAVLAKNGKIIGQGFHKKYGRAHAEIEAAKELSAKAIKGSTMYITLEPCVHFEGKKTGSCSEFIVSNGIKQVFIPHRDPNPNVNGAGIRFLRKNGVNVLVGLQEDRAQKLNEIYIKNMKSSIPFLALKIASSLDGKIATANKSSRWITSLESRKFVHGLRRKYDAIMTTSETVKYDNPHLGVRLGKKGRDPLRIVIDRSLKTDVSAKVYRDKNVLVVCSEFARAGRIGSFIDAGIDLLKIPGREFSLSDTMNQLYKMGIMSVLVEAGGRFAASLLKERLVDRCYYFVAPKFIGEDGVCAVGGLGIREVRKFLFLKDVLVREVGGDVLVEGRVMYGDSR
jgi:diaminohydroxyphosphoribosylaminopyrimidine deaminase/5-amino-6-(5-phosphoribosylamino)uracil reductase